MNRLALILALLVTPLGSLWADDTATNTPSPTASSTPLATLAPTFSLPFVDGFASDLGWSGSGHLGTQAYAGGTGSDGDGQNMVIWSSVPAISPYYGVMISAVSPAIDASSASSLKLRYAGRNLSQITVSVFDGTGWVILQSTASYSWALNGIMIEGSPEVPSQGVQLVQEGNWSVWEFDLNAYKNPALQVKLGSLDIATSPGFDWVKVYDPSTTSLPIYPSFTISPTSSATPVLSPTPTCTATASGTPQPMYELPFVDHFTSQMGWVGGGPSALVTPTGGTGSDGDGQVMNMTVMIPQFAPYCGRLVTAYSPLVNATPASSLKLRYAGYNLDGSSPN